MRRSYSSLMALILTAIALMALSTPSLGQNICSSQNPCVVTLGSLFKNADMCSANYVQEVRDRFLASYFDNGTPTDFTDDPIVFGFAANVNLFGKMQNPNDPMSLPSLETLEQALIYAQNNHVPFVIQLSTWGCQHGCSETQASESLNHLRGFEENYMLSPLEAASGNFPQGMSFSWCAIPSGSVLTYSLLPGVGNPTIGPNELGLQDLIDRNLNHLATWVKSNIYDIPSNRKYLVGVVISGETHFGDTRFGFDYSDAMLTGYRDYVQSRYGCGGSSFTGFSTAFSNCGDLDGINEDLGTGFVDLDSIVPPTSTMDCPDEDYCTSWDRYREAVLTDYLARITSILTDAGIPSGDLFTHELVFAGGFLRGPLEVPGANPGLSAYGRSDEPLFEKFSCPGGNVPCTNHRPWAVVEGYFPTCGASGGTDPACYAASLDDYFAKNARFLHQMPTDGSLGERLLGSNLEKGIHLWGMSYSSEYQHPTANVAYDSASKILSGCVYDEDQKLRDVFDAPGSTVNSGVDANNIFIQVEVDGQFHEEMIADVEEEEPWCGVSDENFSFDLSSHSSSAEIRLLAQDYPSDEWIEVFCHNCGDTEPEVDTVSPMSWIDFPSGAPGEVVSGVITVRGWALDNVEISASNLSFRLNGKVIVLPGLNYGIERKPVCEQFDGENCDNVGFEVDLDTANLANGQNTLLLVVTDPSGNINVQSRAFNVQN